MHGLELDKAQFNLVNAYADGTGVPEGHREAVKRYRLSAAQGHANAQAR